MATTVQQSYAANTEATTSVLKMAEADQPLSSAESETTETLDAIPPPPGTVSQTEAYHDLQLAVINAEKTYIEKLRANNTEWANDFEKLNAQQIEQAITWLRDAINTINRLKPSSSPSPSSSPASYPTTTAPTSQASPAPNSSPSPSPASASYYDIDMALFAKFESIGAFNAWGLGDIQTTIEGLEAKKTSLQRDLASLGGSVIDHAESRKAILEKHIAYVEAGISLLETLQAIYVASEEAAAAVRRARESYDAARADIDIRLECALAELRSQYERNGISVGGKTVKPGEVIGNYPTWSAPDCTVESQPGDGCHASWYVGTPGAEVRLQIFPQALIPYKKASAELSAQAAKDKALEAADYLTAVINYLREIQKMKTPLAEIASLETAYIDFLTTAENERYASGNTFTTTCAPFTWSQSSDCVSPAPGSYATTARSEVYDVVMNAFTALPVTVKSAAASVLIYAKEQKTNALSAAQAEEEAIAKYVRDRANQKLINDFQDGALALLRKVAAGEKEAAYAGCNAKYYGTALTRCKSIAAARWDNFADKTYQNWRIRDNMFWDRIGGYDSEYLNWDPQLSRQAVYYYQQYDPRTRQIVQRQLNFGSIKYPAPYHFSWISDLYSYIHAYRGTDSQEMQKEYQAFMKSIDAAFGMTEMTFRQAKDAAAQRYNSAVNSLNSAYNQWGTTIVTNPNGTQMLVEGIYFKQYAYFDRRRVSKNSQALNARTYARADAWKDYQSAIA
ncbi:MAG: hypothetical protein JXR49_23015 [Acidobacteria bacterium]|nr:hypothetical protein [Acidobacteriota bacterium]